MRILGLEKSNCSFLFQMEENGRAKLAFDEIPRVYTCSREFARWCVHIRPSSVLMGAGKLLMGVPGAVLILTLAFRHLAHPEAGLSVKGAGLLTCFVLLLLGAVLWVCGAVLRWRSVTYLAPAGFGELKPNEVPGAEFGEPEARKWGNDAGTVDTAGSAADLVYEGEDARRQYLPTILAIRKAGKSVLPYDMPCFDPKAPDITWKDARKGRFLFMPEQYRVIRRTLLCVEGEEKRDGAATIEDIRNLPEGTRFRFVRGMAEDFPGEWVSVNSVEAPYPDDTSRLYTREEYLSLYETGDDLFWWGVDDDAHDPEERREWQRVWRNMRRRAGVRNPDKEKK